jgi:hypothetical protein
MGQTGDGEDSGSERVNGRLSRTICSAIIRVYTHNALPFDFVSKRARCSGGRRDHHKVCMPRSFTRIVKNYFSVATAIESSSVDGEDQSPYSVLTDMANLWFVNVITI